jgi:hypothetical protein
MVISAAFVTDELQLFTFEKKFEVNKYNLFPETVGSQKSIVARKQRITSLLRSWLFWNVTQRRLVDSYRRFGTINQSKNQGLLDS